MVAAPSEIIEFLPGDASQVSDVVTRMNQIRRDRDGWINLQPAIDEEDIPPPQTSLGRLFTARGPEVPLCSWVPGARKKTGVEPTSVGVQHASGPKAILRLREAGIEVPGGWRMLADHPRRGLVLAIPDEADPAFVLDWLVRAATALTRITLAGPWRAGIYDTR